MIFIHKETGELALLFIKALKPLDSFCINNKCFEPSHFLLLTNANDKEINNYEFLGVL